MKENAFQILIPPDCDNLQNLFLKPLASDDFKILPIFIFLFSKEFLDIQVRVLMNYQLNLLILNKFSI